MGNTLGLPADDKVALIARREEHGVEVDRPHAVVGFLQTDVLIHERVRDVEQPLLKAERARLGHAFHEEMAPVLWGRESLGVRPARRRIA